jgi:transposase-like protein
MDPTTVCCPNLACPARGQRGQGNIGIHAQQEKRCLCTACRKTFTTTKGTALSRVRTAADTGALVVTLRAHGCPLQASVVAFRVDERTVAAWGRRAGGQGQAVQAYLVEPPRDLGICARISMGSP